MNTQNQFDAIVIGSGMGGITAAAYLAAAGKKTLLLEQYVVLGGCSHVFRRKNKWEFEVGMHYMEDCGREDAIVPSILHGLGIDDKIEFLPLDKDGFDTIVYPDKTLRVPGSWDDYRSNMIALFPKEEKAIKKFIGILETIGSALDRSRTPGSAKGYLQLIKDAGIDVVWAMMPVSTVIDYCGLSHQAKAMLTPQSGAYACVTSKAPIAIHAGMLHGFITGRAWYPKGGGQVFSAHMADVIKTHGSEIKLGKGVKKIIVEGGSVKGVETTDGEKFYAPVVVSNADIKRTYLDMIDPEHLSFLTINRIKNYKMTNPFLNVYLGVELDLRQDTPNTNYYSCPTWLGPDKTFQKLESLKDNRTAFIKEAMNILPAYVHCSNTKDPSNTRYAPEGFSAIEVMTLLPPSKKLWGVHDFENYRTEAEYLDTKEQLTECMINGLTEVLPQVKGKIVFKEAATPFTQERYTWSTQGAAYGIEPNVFQFGPFRPGTKTEIKGLYLTGASTAWGPSIAGGMISAIHAVSAILGRDLDAEVRSGKVIADKSKLTKIKDLDAFDALRASTKKANKAEKILV